VGSDEQEPANVRFFRLFADVGPVRRFLVGVLAAWMLIVNFVAGAGALTGSYALDYLIRFIAPIAGILLLLGPLRVWRLPGLVREMHAESRSSSD
jgi:hypothetical protein